MFLYSAFESSVLLLFSQSNFKEDVFLQRRNRMSEGNFLFINTVRFNDSVLLLFYQRMFLTEQDGKPRKVLQYMHHLEACPVNIFLPLSYLKSTYLNDSQLFVSSFFYSPSIKQFKTMHTLSRTEKCFQLALIVTVLVALQRKTCYSLFA